MSDINTKTNISTLTDSITKLKQLRGVDFNWKEDNRKSMGVIAQELEQVFPELVTTLPNGTKTVTYSGLFAVLIEAIKEQQKEIEELKKR